MPSRRAYLVTLAAAGFTGCLGNSSPSTTDSPTATATTAPSTSSNPPITIEAAAVQYGYRHIENVDWNAIQPADGQFVFVTVDASEATPVPSREAFTLVTADNIHDPTQLDHRYPVDLDVSGEPYMADTEGAEPRGWLIFDVPALLDTGPSLRLKRESDSWELGLDIEKATTPPPSWDWNASAPDTVPPEETFDIRVSAGNVGDGPGTFRGAVNFSFPMYRPKGFDIVLDPGESGEATVSASSENVEPGTELNYGVRTPAGSSTVSVTVETEPNSTETTN